MRQVVFILCLVVLCAPFKSALIAQPSHPSPSLRGLDPSKTISQYIHDVWQEEDGLPHNSITAITQTREGYLWMATHNGLARFDGVRFTLFNQTNTAVFPRPGVTSLCGDRKGNLWVGTRTGLVSWDQKKFSRVGVEGTILSEAPRILETEDGSIWVGTLGGLIRISNGMTISYGPREGLSATRIRALCEDGDGTLWIGTDDGDVVQFKDGKFQTVVHGSVLAGSAVRSIVADSTGCLWIGTMGWGLGVLRDGKFSRLDHTDGLPSMNVRSLLIDRSGSLWVGGEGGLSRYKDGTF